MEGAGERVSRRERLGVWVLGPLLALLLIFVLIFSLPSVNCDEIGESSSSVRDVLAVVACVAAAMTILASLHRFAVLGRRQPIWLWLGPALLAAFVGLAVLSLSTDDNLNTFGFVWFGGLGLSLASLLAILTAWVRGRSAEGAGFLLPLYLMSAGAFWFLPTALVALVLNSGALC